MARRVEGRLADWAGPLWLAVGWVAILFPAIYMTSTGWDSGEHANVPVTVGLVVSAMQGAVWTPIWFASRHWDAATRRLMFGVGVPLSLGASLTLLAATQNSATPYTRMAGASVAYLLIAALVFAGMRRRAAERHICVGG